MQEDQIQETIQPSVQPQGVITGGEQQGVQQMTVGTDALDEKKTLTFQSIPFGASEESFEAFVNAVAPIKKATFLKRPDGSFRGVAICDFETAEEAQKVLDTLNNATFEKRTIHVMFSSSRMPTNTFQQYRPQRPRRRYRTYRDLDAPDDDDNGSRRAYDLPPDQEEKKDDFQLGYDRGSRGHRNSNRGRDYRRYDNGFRSYDRGPDQQPYMGGMNDYRPRPGPY